MSQNSEENTYAKVSFLIKLQASDLRMTASGKNQMAYKNSFNTHRISSNKRPRRLLNFETVRCAAYYRAALIRGRRLFQSWENEQYWMSKPCHILSQNKNET